tara:strand:- start:2120 stop:2503 length:384 start_codon:yes stop_codon:yes gene_type:complete
MNKAMAAGLVTHLPDYIISPPSYMEVTKFHREEALEWYYQARSAVNGLHPSRGLSPLRFASDKIAADILDALIEINLDATGKGGGAGISKMFETVREEVIHARMDKDENNPLRRWASANAGKSIDSF